VNSLNEELLSKVKLANLSLRQDVQVSVGSISLAAGTLNTSPADLCPGWRWRCSKVKSGRKFASPRCQRLHLLPRVPRLTKRAIITTTHTFCLLCIRTLEHKKGLNDCKGLQINSGARGPAPPVIRLMHRTFSPSRHQVIS
jgi:hypothetical protein